VRAQVVLLDGDRLLLARHRRDNGSYWVLPGGSVESGETPEDAAVREVREETGLEIVLVRLLFVEEPRQAGSVTVTSPRYTFLGKVIGGRLCAVYEPNGGGNPKGYLAGAEWMPFESWEYDQATMDTLERVREALSGR